MLGILRKIRVKKVLMTRFGFVGNILRKMG